MFPTNPFLSTAKAAPAQREVAAKRPTSPWLTCEIGESWLVKDYTDRKAYMAATTHGRRYGKKFTSAREGYGMRITRIA